LARHCKKFFWPLGRSLLSSPQLVSSYLER